jgi:outer membrane immunogenic protein
MKIKLSLILGVGVAAWMAAVAPAVAADIAAAPVVKAPVQAPGYNWYGFYIGVQGGYGFGRNSVNFTPDAFYLPAFAAGVAPTSAAGNPQGAIGGAMWGSNWQFDRIVLGTEGDFSFSDIKSNQTTAGTFGAIPFTGSISQRMSWFSTSRVRGGFLLGDHILLYAAGGLASGHVESSSSTVAGIGGCLIPGTCPRGSASGTRYGWTAGGGVEYADGPWQFRVEYLHYDLGTQSYTVSDPLLPFNGIQASTRFAGDIVRGGISYRFNWTPLGILFGTDKF